MNRESRRAFDSAARKVAEAFERAGPFPGQEVTPPLLIEALGQCLDIVAQEAQQEALEPGEIDEIATHALECVSDLALWAYQLGLERERGVIEDLAFDFARWAAGHDGAIRVLEPVVNSLARRANASHDRADLARLFETAREILMHADPAHAAGGPGEPWHVLHFNLAIIATRTQQPELMHTAYDLLEQNLPAQCAAFYEEGVRQAEKRVYAQHVRDIMRERHAKWTTRH